ncbi:MAG: DNA-binding response regulator, partial [Nautilia sp.]
MYKIVVVDDEEDILELIEFTLSEYEVFTFTSVNGVKELLDKENIDLIIMDRNLPGIEGSVFISELRKEGITIPVIYLSAKDKEEDILEGFERGGDDYITKPFSLKELKARIKAVLKRTKKEVKILKYRDIVFNLDTREVKIDDKIINLTHLEKDLLLEFLKNPNRVLSRELLLENVWKNAFDKQLKTVNVAIKRLKEKIDPENKK